MTARSHYLIIGNSAAATGAIEGIRAVDSTNPITLISREPHHVYSRPLISYFLAGCVEESRMWYRPPDFYEKNGVQALLGVEAKRIDVRGRHVLTSGGDSLTFDKLLIATGGRPVLPMGTACAGVEGIFSFTTLGDILEIRGFMEKSAVRRAAVIGGGLIGIKATEALISLGVKVTVVELADRILASVFDETASRLALEFMERAGVRVMCGTTMAGIEDRRGKVTGIVLESGTRIPCDMVIVAIGVVPDVSVLEGTSIAVDRGILVDSFMRTSAEEIYAAGDVAQTPDLLSGERRNIPIFPNAYRQGYVAGNNMAGRRRMYEGAMSMNAVDVFGLPVISVGITNPRGKEYEIISRLDEKAFSYKKMVLRNDRIVGAIFAGEIDRAGIITGLIKEKIKVTGFKDLLLTESFGLISLPVDYRKYIVSGMGIEV